ncbi:MAG: class I SAM-dependent methyltransferase [Protaetiibacter sp.]
MGRAGRVEGRITRGTTGVNRLRRVDRWIAAQPVLRTAADPLVVDLGYGASATTSTELHARLARVRPDIEVLGIEIDPERVRLAAAAARPGVSFRLGGFEVPTDDGRRPAVIRAMNVLRQYEESEVADAWARMRARLAPGGLLVEGTCDELGRVASWVTLDEDGPRLFTASLRLAQLEAPSIVAERLPKALIHRNVPGERVHALLADLDRAWARHAPLSVYGPVQRWQASVASVRDAGWPVLDTPPLGGRARWRLGELTLPWPDVAPRPWLEGSQSARDTPR